MKRPILIFRSALVATLVGLGFSLGSTGAYADSFDDAVTHFLKGFDHCKEAKAHLSGGRLSAAQSSLKQYQRLLSEASAINRDILTTNQRGMDGNLKYCQRVARDVEVEAGMPVLNKALAACDSAQTALQEGKPDQAKTQLAEFRNLKTEALATSPSLNDIFTVKNQISRCERIENKIAASSKQQEALALSLETAQEESAAFHASCQKTLEQLNREKVDDPVLRDARQGQSSAASHRKNVAGERLAQAHFKEQPKDPVKLAVDANLKQGDQCMAGLSQALTRKEQELAAIKARFTQVSNQLKSATADCEQAGKTAGGTPSKQIHATARSGYEKALQSRTQVRDGLAKDAAYRQYDGWDNVRGIEKGMATLNQCLDNTRQELDRLFAALPAAAPVATPAAPPAAKPAATATVAASAITTTPAEPAAKPADAAQNGVAASRFSGTLRLLNLAPEFALFYVPDGTRPRAPEIIIDRAGFDSPLYIGASGDTLTLRNRDNTAHRVTVSADGQDKNDIMARLQPRQSRTSSIDWPEHRIVTLRADSGALAASYVANVPSANYQQIKLESAGKDIPFKFQNDKGSKSAYLIMPDADPLTFTLLKGETKSLAITRKGVPAGSLLVTGE